MELHAHPVQGQNTFVVNEKEADFFAVALNDAPRFADILAQVFNLNDPEVVRVLDEKFDSGTLILGYLETDRELDIHVPLKQNEYVNKRLEEVFEAEIGIE